MTRPIKILIASGAFKDVFSPSEACEMLDDVIRNVTPPGYGLEIRSVPMADGGEHSDEVLAAANPSSHRIEVSDVIDPRKSATTSSYLELDEHTAFLTTSRILGLPPALDEYKNPLELTSYGFGQLLRDALERGFSNLVLGMGGTSTVDGGLGTAQALGIEVFDENSRPLPRQDDAFLRGFDLGRIAAVSCSHVPQRWRRVPMTVLCDTRISVDEMSIPTELKIGRRFDADRHRIVARLEKGLRSYCRVLETELRVELMPQATLPLHQSDSLGVAGGLLLSLVPFFDLRLVRGADYFAAQQDLDQAIEWADLVVTGEGRFDISIEGKTPIAVSRLAHQHGKPTLLVCGSVDNSLRELFPSPLTTDLPPILAENGIDALIRCPRSHGETPDRSYRETVEYYRRSTPDLLSRPVRNYVVKHFAVKHSRDEA